MLEIRGLTKSYANGVRALRGVDLRIGHGLFGLLGPNGAGKSTLMRIAATLQQPDGGEVRFDSVDIFDDPSRHRSALGYLPQDFGVYPGVSAVRLLDHLAVLKGITNGADRGHEVERRLRQCNLWDARTRAVSSYSGGMRQRFGIAQALLGNPRLIIVDEPTAGLDPEERNRFHNLLSEISESVVVILSTHIAEDVRQLCTRMAILASGVIVREGEPDRLTEALGGEIWTTTVDRGDRVTAHSNDEGVRVLSTQLHGGRRSVRVRSSGSPGPMFAQTEPTLEDVYFDALRSDDSGAG